MTAGRIALAQVPFGNAVKTEEQVIVASIEMLARTGHQWIDVARIVVVGLLDRTVMFAASRDAASRTRTTAVSKLDIA